MEKKMYLKTPPSKMKKRPREESYIQRPGKSRLLVDVHDREIGETKVSLVTPPIRTNKRPCAGSGKEALKKFSTGLVCGKDDLSEKTKVVLFRVLLPNGSCVELKISDPRNAIPIEEFIDLVRNEYHLLLNQMRSSETKRRIMWEYPDIHFSDAHSNKIKIEVDLSEFAPRAWHLLWLHDGSPEPDEYEDMWDLTPDTDLLKELPDDYTCETALADLIDNSLQALWSNGKGERRLISVDMQPGKITIFDTAPGMDGASGNIVKWGKMGASLHRSVREKAIGGEPPYLMPFFGMFGYGGPVATMCLGRRSVVSSKTKESNKVFTLHMEREALVSASHTENCWKTKGGVRDPSEDEKRYSPHGSFTQVEIFDSKQKVNKMYLKRLRRKLKDIYFPYIQCDEVSGKTSRPIEFQVNGIDLAGVQGGEVAITNLLSCNGPDFIVQLHFSISPGSSTSGHNQRVSTEANARLKCVYYPIVEGKENIERILDKLDEDGCEIRETFESFSRVSVRRLGRLLPETRWALLPFMEPKQKKGEKTKILKRLCSRVKCFIDTDSGFNPTPHKTDLAHHHPYTKALKNFGNRSPEDEGEVQVEITRDGMKLTVPQLHKLYHDWISDMHDRYDEETVIGLDKPTIIVASTKIKKLDLSSEVLRVHKKIKRKERCWEAGQNVKVLKGACAGCHNGNVYATLEYIIIEGLEGDPSGEARLICRPLGVPAKRGCWVPEDSTGIDINDSYVFPIRIIDSGKCIPVDDGEWGKKLETHNKKLPAAIDLLSLTDCEELQINGGLPTSPEAGDAPPEKIVAVLRPKSFEHENCSRRLDQKFIVRDSFQMSLDLKRRGTASKGDAGDHVYSIRLPASSHKGLCGLYIFPLRERFPELFQEPGIFTFSFSVMELKDIQLQRVVQVQPSAGVGSWKVLHQDKNEFYSVGAGSCFKPLSIACYDKYKKRALFSSVPKLCIKLISSGQTLADVCSKKVELSSDKSVMKLKDIFIKTSKLDVIRPRYEATLSISTVDEAYYVDFPCRVIPGPAKKIVVHPRKLRKQVIPGQILEELELEVFDEYGNHVKEGENISLRLDGLSFQDGMDIIRKAGIDCIKKVNANGRIDLSNALKVSRGYGKKVLLSVITKGDVIFELQFQTERRELRAVQQVFKNCEAGSLLENIEFEIIDSEGEGEVDETIHDEDKHGQSHTLEIKSKSFCFEDSARYKFYHGSCTVPSIPLPHKEGVFFFQAAHSRYLELKTTIEVHVEKRYQENNVGLTNHDGSPIPSARRLFEDEPTPRSGSSCILRSQVGASISQEVHVEKMQQENHETASNLKDFSPIISSEDELIIVDSPPLEEPQIAKETISPHSSNGFVSSISHSPSFMTPKLEHANARHGISQEGLEDDLARCGLKMFGHERSLCSLHFKQSEIQQQVSSLQAQIGPDLCNASSSCTQQSTLEQIKSRSQSAAAVICKMREEELSRHDILGVVAHLGTVRSIQLSRMLARYLGEDQMLAIVCRSYEASYSLETTLGHSTNGGYLALCVEDIRPEPLPLQQPTLPNGNVPRGFLGYAVNMICIEASYLEWRTKDGHDLRETLFYRLFGDLQVYIDRDCMAAAHSCIKAGAVSLDGRLMRGNGLICLGNWEPEILFPMTISGDKLRLMRILEAQQLELEKIKRRIEDEEEAYCRSKEEVVVCRNMYNSFMSQQGV